jgi:uncharacterized membrane protein YfcA
MESSITEHMDPVLLIALVFVGLFAGIMGALFGIGGGMIIVPILTIGLGMAAKDAAAISLVGIVATSVGASSVYVGRGISNIRLGLFLEIGTVIGAIVGVFIAIYISNFVLTIVFSAVTVYAGYRMLAEPEKKVMPTDDQGKYNMKYFDETDKKYVGYNVRNLGKGAAISSVAGVIASMTGMGGGTIKVPVMNMYMGVPMKVATATSNYMIGITAFAGAILYFILGEIDLMFAGTVAVGGFIGSMIGTRISPHIDGKALRKYFAVLLFIVAVIMVLNAGGCL